MGVENTNIGESIEIIDNEINDKLCNLEEKCDHGYALALLDLIDKNINDFDLDIAYDSVSKSYRFISNENVLDIPIYNKDQLQNLGDIIVKISTEDTYITGWLHNRSIKVDEFLQPETFDETIISSDSGIDKNTIEDIFKFVMDAKGLTIEDWDIRGKIMKGEQDQKLYHDFGSKDSWSSDAIRQKIKSQSTQDK